VVVPQQDQFRFACRPALAAWRNEAASGARFDDRLVVGVDHGPDLPVVIGL
jgi:hypothetical protein